MIECTPIGATAYELAAQHLAYRYLVRACEHAMYDLSLEGRDDPQVMNRAVEILEEVHEGWRDILSLLRTEVGRNQETFTSC